MMNRYNFLRILALAAGFGLGAWWTIFDQLGDAVAEGIGLGALICGGVCGCWVLIGIAERRARLRRFMLNQPNASERREMEREKVKFKHALAKVGGMRHVTDAEIDAMVEAEAALYPSTTPLSAPGEIVIQTPEAERHGQPFHEQGGARPSPFAHGGVIREASVVIVTRALHAIRVEVEGVSPEERAIVGERVARLARELMAPAGAPDNERMA